MQDTIILEYNEKDNNLTPKSPASGHETEVVFKPFNNQNNYWFDNTSINAIFNLKTR